MELFVITSEYQKLDTLDSPITYSVVEKYRGKGEFTLSLPPTQRNLDLIKNDRLIVFDIKKGLAGVINKVEIDCLDPEKSYTMAVSGPLCEDYLYRRICWGLYTKTGTPEEIIQDMIQKQVISPDDPRRAISDIEILSPAGVLGESLSYQNTGGVVGENIEELCASLDLGFRAWLDLKAEKIYFQTYKGTDRSLDQKVVSPVIFSQDQDNFVGSFYSTSLMDHKNVALVAGEGEGKDRKTVQVGETSGKFRREIFVDARDLQSQDSEGGTIPESEYLNSLKQRGDETLGELPVVMSFDCDISPQGNMVFNKDFFLGDIVSVQDLYTGVSTSIRITEAETVQDSSGESLRLTFGFGQLTLGKKLKVLGVK